MRYPTPLIPARFLRRSQRFLAEVELVGGGRQWVHVPNSGALTGCLEVGMTILLTREHGSGRKTPFSWRFCRVGDQWVCVDTLAPNRVVAEALAGPGLPGLAGPLRARSEVTIPGGGRLDFEVWRDGGRLFLEVKSITWVEEGVALFPDGVTIRGRRHLQQLAALVRQGHEAWQVFVVQRGDARIFRPAAHVDPAYAQELRLAASQGVKIVVLQESVSPPEITLASPLPFDLS